MSPEWRGATNTPVVKAPSPLPLTSRLAHAQGPTVCHELHSVLGMGKDEVHKVLAPRELQTQVENFSTSPWVLTKNPWPVVF